MRNHTELMSAMFLANTSLFNYLIHSEFHITLIQITSLCRAPQNKTTPIKHTFKCVTVGVYSVQNLMPFLH
jgi:hypothetical protein